MNLWNPYPSLVFKCVLLGCFFLAGFLTLPCLSSAEQTRSEEIHRLLDSAFNAYVEKNYETALYQFRKALEIDPTDETALTGVRQCEKKLKHKLKKNKQLVEYAYQYIRQEQWVQAADSLKKILKKFPGYPLALEAHQKLEDSLKNRKKKSNSGSIDFYLYQGLMEYLSQNYEGSMNSWKKVLDLDPSHIKASIYIEHTKDSFEKTHKRQVLTSGKTQAREAFESENYPEAIRLWNEVLKYQPNDSEAQKALKQAQTLNNQKNRQQLIGSFYDEGIDLFFKAKYAQSLQAWEQILNIDPNNEVAQNYVRKIRAKGILKSRPGKKPQKPKPTNNKIPKAGTLSQKTPLTLPKTKIIHSLYPTPKSEQTRKNPDSIPIEQNLQNQFFKKGIRLYQAGKYPEAAAYFERQVKKRPKSLPARDWLEKIKKVQEKKAETLYNQGLVAYTKGDLETAMNIWRQALTVYPNHSRTKKVIRKIQKKKRTNLK